MIAQQARTEPLLETITTVPCDGTCRIVRVRREISGEDIGQLQRLLPHVVIESDESNPVIPKVGSTQPCAPGFFL